MCVLCSRIMNTKSYKHNVVVMISLHSCFLSLFKQIYTP